MYIIRFLSLVLKQRCITKGHSIPAALLFIRNSADGSRRFENLYESSRLFEWIFCLQEVHFRQMQATIYMIR